MKNLSTGKQSGPPLEHNEWLKAQKEEWKKTGWNDQSEQPTVTRQPAAAPAPAPAPVAKK